MGFPTVASYSGLVIFLSQSILTIVGAEVCIDGDIRLVGGPNVFEGRLEYCLNSKWGHVCGDMWNFIDGIVACRQLGHGSSNSIAFSGTQHYGAQEGLANLNSLQCLNTELRLSDCTKETLGNQTGCSSLGGYAYLVCSDPSCSGFTRGSARLVDGRSTAIGRLELCNTAGLRFGVCDDSWDDNDARVICRELGLLQEGVDPVAIAGYQVTTSRVSAFTDVDCLGNESDVTDCSRNPTTLFPSCSFAGVNCSDFGVSSVSPVQSSTIIDLLPSSTLQLTPSSSKATITDIPTVTSTISPLSSAVPSRTPPPPPPVPNTNDITLIAAVVGAVGVVIVMLLVLVIILFVVILARRRQTTHKYDVPQQNNLNESSVSIKQMEMSLDQSTKEDTAPRNGSVSEYDHVLLNPLYKMRSRSNTASSNRTTQDDENGYAEINRAVQKHSPLLQVKDTLNDGYGYDVPIDAAAEDGSLVHHEYSTLVESDNNLQPQVDEQGYAALQEHLYDDMESTTLSYPLELKVATTVLSASPYETPLIPSYESSEIAKGLLVSPSNKNMNRESCDSPLDGKLTAEHEYRALEETNVVEREYENPIVTLNGESTCMELHTIPEYDSIDPR